MPNKPDRSKINPFRHQQYLRGSQEKLDRLAASLYPKGMDTPAAKHRLRVLEFWEKHGTEAARDAFGVGRTTLYRWKKARWDARGLEPKSRARRENHQRRVDPRVLAEAVRLRTEHPRLGKEKLLPLLRAFCERERVAEPLSESRVGRILGDLRRAGRLPDPRKLRMDARSGLLVERKAPARKAKLGGAATCPSRRGTWCRSTPW